ncbi:MAG: CvpA family protein [Chthoniobacterales bacterium]
MSPQTLLIVGGIFLLYHTIRGWQKGVARCFVSLVALGFSSLAGYYFGTLAAPVLRGILPYPDFIIALVAGFIVALLVYISIWIFSIVLLKRTSHQKSGIIRFFYGIGGGVLGCFYGLLMLGAIISLFRVFGSYAESQANNDSGARKHALHSSPALDNQLVRIKKTLESGLSGSVVEKTDIIPAKLYDTLEKSGRVSANPEAISRFGNEPAVQKLKETPQVAAILNDAEFNEAAANRDFVQMLRNKNVIAAANDPEFRKLIMEFDLNKALDHALQKPPQKQKKPQPTP